jgi:hypothetical protein
MKIRPDDPAELTDLLDQTAYDAVVKNTPH